MSPTETAGLLRYAATLDRWLRETDPEAGQMMVAGWASMLAEVPLEVAQGVVRDHYAEPDARTLTPGDVLGVWRARQRRERQAAEDQARTAEAVSIQQALDAGAGPVFGSGAQYLADMMAVVAEGGDPATVVRPAGVRVRVLSPEAEARERACRFPDICVCTHLECRDGWLDEPGTRVDQLGRTREAVVRCPQCDDGLQMAQERGVTRRPRKAASR